MPLEWKQFTDFDGGQNDVQHPRRIADNEFSQLLNFEFSEQGSIRSRGGFVRYNTSPDFTSRITSLYNFITAAQVSNLILTTGSEIYKDTSGVFTSIKGALTLPTNTYWQWRTFNDLAIGVNGDSGAVDDTVKWSGAGNAAALALTGISGAPVGAFTLEVFNSRLWMVFKSHPNRVYFSTLGNPEDWVASGGFIEVGYNDNDTIVGIYAHNGVLFVLKKRSIHFLQTRINGQVATDPAGWKIDVLTKGGGCISQFGIQVVLNDLVFPSYEGLISLKAVQQFGDFSAAIVSRKVTGLFNLNLSIDTFPSAVLMSKSMYLIGAPKTTTGTVNNRFYVMDYKQLEGGLRWTTFESSIVNPSAMIVALISGKPILFVGSDTPNFQLYKYDDTVFSDHGNTPILKRFEHKSFNFGNSLIDKECKHAALGINFSGSQLSATWKVRIDNNNSKVATIPLSVNNVSSGGVWDTGTWDVSLFASSTENEQLIVSRIRGTQGYRGKEFQHIFENDQLGQDITIQTLGFGLGTLVEESTNV